MHLQHFIDTCRAQNANLWDVTSAPTIVMTQRGARRAFQDTLAAAGVEVVQFDFLTPEAVAAYCQERGFLQARPYPWPPMLFLSHCQERASCRCGAAR